MRLEQQAAQTIQRVWRGRRSAAEIIDQLLVELQVDGDDNDVDEVMRRCRALLVVTWKGVGGYRTKDKAIEIDRWAAMVATPSDGKLLETRQSIPLLNLKQPSARRAISRSQTPSKQPTVLLDFESTGVQTTGGNR